MKNFLLPLFFLLSTNLLSQKTITYIADKQPLSTVLDVFHNTFNVEFNYSHDAINAFFVNNSFEHLSLETALEKLFYNTPFYYDISNYPYISIKRHTTVHRITGSLYTEFGEPIENGHITYNNSREGDISDEYGDFEIHRPQKPVSDSIKISHIGHQTRFFHLNSTIPKKIILYTKPHDLVSVEVNLGKESQSPRDKKNTPGLTANSETIFDHNRGIIDFEYQLKSNVITQNISSAGNIYNYQNDHTVNHIPVLFFGRNFSPEVGLSITNPSQLIAVKTSSIPSAENDGKTNGLLAFYTSDTIPTRKRIGFIASPSKLEVFGSLPLFKKIGLSYSYLNAISNFFTDYQPLIEEKMAFNNPFNNFTAEEIDYRPSSERLNINLVTSLKSLDMLKISFLGLRDISIFNPLQNSKYLKSIHKSSQLGLSAQLVNGLNKDKTIMDILATYVSYSHGEENNILSDSGQNTNSFLNNTRDAQIRFQIKQVINSKNNFTLGLLTRYISRHYEVSLNPRKFELSDIIGHNNSGKRLGLTFFNNLQGNKNKIGFNIGSRTTYHPLIKKIFFEPRALIQFQFVKNASINASAGRFTQLDGQLVSLQSVNELHKWGFWSNIEPIKTTKLNFEYSLNKKKWELDIEAYFNKINDISYRSLFLISEDNYNDIIHLANQTEFGLKIDNELKLNRHNLKLITILRKAKVNLALTIPKMDGSGNSREIPDRGNTIEVIFEKEGSATVKTLGGRASFKNPEEENGKNTHYTNPSDHKNIKTSSFQSPLQMVFLYRFKVNQKFSFLTELNIASPKTVTFIRHSLDGVENHKKLDWFYRFDFSGSYQLQKSKRTYDSEIVFTVRNVFNRSNQLGIISNIQGKNVVSNIQHGLGRSFDISLRFEF